MLLCQVSSLRDCLPIAKTFHGMEMNYEVTSSMPLPSFCLPSDHVQYSYVYAKQRGVIQLMRCCTWMILYDHHAAGMHVITYVTRLCLQPVLQRSCLMTGLDEHGIILLEVQAEVTH